MLKKPLRYGCIDYLLKPVEKQDLLSILSKYNNISQNSKMEEQYERLSGPVFDLVAVRQICPNGVDYLHKHLDFSDGVRYIEISACHSSDGEDDDDENHFRMVQRDLYQSCVQILGEDRSRCFCDASLDRVGYGIAFGLQRCAAPESPAVPKHSISRIFIRNWVFRHNTNCDFWLAKKWTISPLFLNRMIPSAG